MIHSLLRNTALNYMSCASTKMYRFGLTSTNMCEIVQTSDWGEHGKLQMLVAIYLKCTPHK